MKSTKREPAAFVRSAVIASLLLATALGTPSDAAAGINFSSGNFEGTESVGTVAGAGECLLSQQLKDVYVRAEYEAAISGSNTRKKAGWLEDQGTWGRKDYSGLVNGRDPVDPLSMECLYCHDGVVATRIGLRVKESRDDRNFVSDAIAGDHPVGMLYEDDYSGNREYREWDTLPADMVFMNGRMGCLTCHDMLNNRKAHLVVDNVRSALCFSCHNK